MKAGFVFKKVKLKSHSVSLHDKVAGCDGRFGQHPVVNGEQGQLQTVGNPCLIVDAPQVILHYLLGSCKAKSDLLVFAALDDERDDLHLLGSEAIANANTYRILFMDSSLASVGDYASLTLDDTAHALDERRSADGAMHGAVGSIGKEWLDGFMVFGNYDGAAPDGANASHKLKCV